MAVENITLTISAADLYELARPQVEARLRETLLAEINRRWPEGFTLPVRLPQSAD